MSDDTVRCDEGTKREELEASFKFWIGLFDSVRSGEKSRLCRTTRSIEG